MVRKKTAYVCRRIFQAMTPNAPKGNGIAVVNTPIDATVDIDYLIERNDQQDTNSGHVIEALESTEATTTNE